MNSTSETRDVCLFHEANPPVYPTPTNVQYIRCSCPRVTRKDAEVTT